MIRRLIILLLIVGCALAITTEDIYDNSWAVVIGIDKYEKVQNLNYAVKDARSMKSIMVKYFDFPKDNVIMLLNEEATYYNIRRQFSEVSILLIYERVIKNNIVFEFLQCEDLILLKM